MLTALCNLSWSEGVFTRLAIEVILAILTDNEKQRRILRKTKETYSCFALGESGVLMGFEIEGDVLELMEKGSMLVKFLIETVT